MSSALSTRMITSVKPKPASVCVLQPSSSQVPPAHRSRKRFASCIRRSHTCRLVRSCTASTSSPSPSRTATSAMRIYTPGERLLPCTTRRPCVNEAKERDGINSVLQADIDLVEKRKARSLMPIFSTVSLGLLAAGAALAEAPPLDLRVAGTTFEPSQPVGWEIWFGFIIGLTPFVVAAYEFGKRIIIQRQCAVCNGSGLVQRGGRGFKRKCPSCGGFLPWESWEMFLTSKAGNGGVVRPPKGQTSVIYDVASAVEASERMKVALDEQEKEEKDNQVNTTAHKTENEA